MNYATRYYPTSLRPTNGRSRIRHSITPGDGESSDRLVLRNVLINYLTGNTQNRIIALKPKHSYHQNKGNLLPKPMLHPDISTKHKDMTFLLSNNTQTTEAFSKRSLRESQRRRESRGTTDGVCTAGHPSTRHGQKCRDLLGVTGLFEKESHREHLTQSSPIPNCVLRTMFRFSLNETTDLLLAQRNYFSYISVDRSPPFIPACTWLTSQYARDIRHLSNASTVSLKARHRLLRSSRFSNC